MNKTRFVISDRRYRKWNEKCCHEMNPSGSKHCNLLLDEDTGRCPKGHGISLHSCKTKCCIVWVGGNHKFCEGHRKNKVESICKVTDRILRRYRSIMWGKLSKSVNLDIPEHRQEFENWKTKQIDATYSKEFLTRKKVDVI